MIAVREAKGRMYLFVGHNEMMAMMKVSGMVNSWHPLLSINTTTLAWAVIYHCFRSCAFRKRKEMKTIATTTPTSRRWHLHRVMSKSFSLVVLQAVTTRRRRNVRASIERAMPEAETSSHAEVEARTPIQAIGEFVDYLHILLSALLECAPRAAWEEYKRLDRAALLRKAVMD
ncbi:hypothetical protein Patl1_23650 [Pistacia atlantica]|uniref:Uncharacterized protein n=1 Tax=Pistacia atlantica TaxID=434234 RepID=A0ACC0ZXW3_9ROSI|nr:hypothetical protein Patl1_23650 [Pistacia atlantica]